MDSCLQQQDILGQDIQSFVNPDYDYQLVNTQIMTPAEKTAWERIGAQDMDDLGGSVYFKQPNTHTKDTYNHDEAYWEDEQLNEDDLDQNIATRNKLRTLSYATQNNILSDASSQSHY